MYGNRINLLIQGVGTDMQPNSSTAIDDIFHNNHVFILVIGVELVSPPFYSSI